MARKKRGRKVKVQLSPSAAHAIFMALGSAIEPSAFWSGSHPHCAVLMLDEAHARELSKVVAAQVTRAPKQRSKKPKKKK